MPSAPSAAAAEGLSADTTVLTPFYREAHHPNDAATVRGLPVPQLLVLFDALEAANEALTGIYNQPRCGGEAADLIEAMMERQSDVRSYIVEELQRRPMTGNRTDDETVMGYVVAWDLKACGCSALEAMTTLTKMNAAHEAARAERLRASGPSMGRRAA